MDLNVYDIRELLENKDYNEITIYPTTVEEVAMAELLVEAKVAKRFTEKRPPKIYYKLSLKKAD